MVAPDTAPVALLWGESDFLLRESAREMFGEVRPTETDARAWQAGLTADLATPSLFGEERGLLITQAQDLPDEGLAEVARYAEQPAPGARLVMTMVVSARSRGPTQKLLKGLPGVKVRRITVERRDLPGWVRERAESRALRASPAGANALIQTIGEDPALLDQAVAQIADAHPAHGLTPETVAAQFRGFGDRRIWELCDAAFGRDLPAALRSMTAMLEAGEEPLAILGGIAARLRDLIRIRALPSRTPPGEIARAAGLRFDWQARRYRDQARRFPDGALARFHADVVEADRSLKMGGLGDVVLTQVVIRIAKGAAGREGAGGRIPRPGAVPGVGA